MPRWRITEKAVERSSTPAEKVAALFNRGRIYNRLHQYDEALKDLDQVTHLAPAFGLTYIERGLAYALNNDNPTAIAEFDKAIALLPPGVDQAIAYSNRAAAYDALGDLQAALADLDQATEVAPEFTPAHSEKERVQKKSLDAGSVVDKRPSDPQAPHTSRKYEQQGWTDFESDHLVEALVSFGRAIELSPQDHKPYYGRGVVNARLRRYEQALADLNQALEMEPSFPAALTERGLVYVETGDYNQGMNEYNRAIKTDPNFALAHINKGSLYALQGKWREALSSLNEGIRLHPSPEAYFNRAACYEQLGEYRRAIEDLRTFIQRYPQDPHVEEARQRLVKMEEKSNVGG